MRKFRIIVLLFFVTFAIDNIVCDTGFALTTLNGNDWIRRSIDFKLMYLLGYIDGRNRGIIEALEIVSPEILLKLKDDPRISSLDTNITVGQILDGVNTFYSDYRNRVILVYDAILIITDEAMGKKHWTEEELQRLRRASSQRKTDKD